MSGSYGAYCFDKPRSLAVGVCNIHGGQATWEHPNHWLISLLFYLENDISEVKLLPLIKTTLGGPPLKGLAQNSCPHGNCLPKTVDRSQTELLTIYFDEPIARFRHFFKCDIVSAKRKSSWTFQSTWLFGTMSLTRVLSSYIAGNYLCGINHGDCKERLVWTL